MMDMRRTLRLPWLNPLAARLLELTREPTGRDAGCDPPEEEDAVVAWYDRIGSVVEQCLDAGFVYGPVRRHWSGDDLVVGANWKRGRREPYRDVQRVLGDNWPSPAASCSPFAEVVLRLLYDLRGDEYGAISRSVTKAIKNLPALADVAEDAHPRGWRAFDFDSLPDPLPQPLCLVLYRGHVVLLVDCDVIPVRDRVTRRRHRGIWVIGADGSFDDASGRNGVIVRRYSCQPLRWEPVATRAERQRGYSDRRRLFRVVGLAPPERWPATPPRLVVQ